MQQSVLRINNWIYLAVFDVLKRGDLLCGGYTLMDAVVDHILPRNIEAHDLLVVLQIQSDLVLLGVTQFEESTVSASL